MSRNSVLVDAAWIHSHQADPDVVIIEVDEDTSVYDDGHIQNAVRLDWRTDLQHPSRRDFIDKAAFEDLMGSNGISDDQTVMLYGGNNNWFAAYAFWYFKVYGHRDVRLLDGGRKKWELDGNRLVRDVPVRTSTTYVAREPDPTIRSFRDEVISSIGVRSIVDVRSPDEFAGRILAPAHLPQEQSQVGGHVPTAKNVPWSQAAREDGTFKSDAELTSLYRDAGVDLDATDTIVYCRIGERSAHTWFVLTQLLGLQNVKNYDGSWVEYGSLVGVPIAK
jgi:thiosulfate/3-mercaptopyruvate sulfurtransferase